MKILGIALALLVCTSSWAQTDITPGVSQAIKSGNAEKLVGYFDASIDLTILGDEGSYAPLLAQKKLQVFFAGNATKSFSIMHKGTSKLGDEYRIGDLVTATGTYRVTFFMHRSGSNMTVKQLRIESFEEDDF